MYLEPIILIVMAVGLLLLILIQTVRFWSAFVRELRYLNDEIMRASEIECPVWMFRRRKLWLSLIPFVRYRP